MKKGLIIVLFLIITMFPSTVLASSGQKNTSIEYLDDGSYFLTIIQDELSNTDAIVRASAKTTTTKSKTTYYKNSSGTTMWYVKVTGTFTYGAGTSTCKKATVTAESKNSAWTVSNKSAKAYDNKAKATATGKRHFNGVVVDTITKNVILTCSTTGKFS